jgi:GcrA cell cycle regulator
MTWTDERAAIATQLWGEGQSASQIACALGGLTRNAVCGFIHRNNLPKRGRPANKPQLSREEKGRRQIERHDARVMGRPVPTFKVVRKKKRAPYVFLGITLADLEYHHCRFPRGGNAPYLFCGQDRQRGSSYCDACHRIAYGRIPATPEQIERAAQARAGKRKTWSAAA